MSPEGGIFKLLYTSNVILFCFYQKWGQTNNFVSIPVHVLSLKRKYPNWWKCTAGKIHNNLSISKIALHLSEQ